MTYFEVKFEFTRLVIYVYTYNGLDHYFHETSVRAVRYGQGEREMRRRRRRRHRWKGVLGGEGWGGKSGRMEWAHKNVPNTVTTHEIAPSVTLLTTPPPPPPPPTTHLWPSTPAAAYAGLEECLRGLLRAGGGLRRQQWTSDCRGGDRTHTHAHRTRTRTNTHSHGLSLGTRLSLLWFRDYHGLAAVQVGWSTLHTTYCACDGW